jgi:hypothetical protein
MKTYTAAIAPTYPERQVQAYTDIQRQKHQAQAANQPTETAVFETQIETESPET